MKVRNVSNCVIYHIGRSPPATRLLWAPRANIPPVTRRRGCWTWRPVYPPVTRGSRTGDCRVKNTPEKSHQHSAPLQVCWWELRASEYLQTCAWLSLQFTVYCNCKMFPLSADRREAESELHTCPSVLLVRYDSVIHFIISVGQKLGILMCLLFKLTKGFNWRYKFCLHRPVSINRGKRLYIYIL